MPYIMQQQIRESGFEFPVTALCRFLDDATQLSIIHRTERTDTLTAENIHDAFRKYFPADRYTTATLLPEKGTQ